MKIELINVLNLKVMVSNLIQLNFERNRQYNTLISTSLQGYPITDFLIKFTQMNT